MGVRSREAERELDSTADSLKREQVSGWSLVERAQQVVHQRFRDYSCLHWWESPATAFARRRGYCVQYNTALQHLLDRLGVDCAPVHAFRVSMADDPAWRRGHMWLRVVIAGEIRDVCAGCPSLDAVPERFEPLSPVRRFGSTMRVLTPVGMALSVTAALLYSAISRQPRPRWLHHAFSV